MKDLDFDELDKAVNSLMKTVPDPPTTEESAVASKPLSPVVPAAPVVVEPAAVPSAPSAKSPEPVKPTSNLAEKRPGRFMDVMHSSSDMRPVQQKSLPSSRQGVSLSPISPNVTPEVSKQPAKPTLLSEVKIPSTDTIWPDPIDIHKSLQDELPTTKTDTATLQPKDTPVGAVTDNTNNSTTSNTSESNSDDTSLKENADTKSDNPELISPFLADAKVEKRPLGGGSSNSLPDTKAEEQIEETTSDSVATPTDDSPTPTQTPLPAELGQEITAIEADSSTSHPLKGSSVQATETGNVPATFIVKQYKEKESSGDKIHSAIYDHNTQPLAHPVKKKSGWGVVILILVLILLGGGGAAALFFLGII